MKEFFDDTITSFHVDTWKEAMEAITKGEADYAVLPIENSTAGIVSDIYDLLVEYPHYIVGEQELPVEHVLMALPGAKAEEIRTVIRKLYGARVARSRHWPSAAVFSIPMKTGKQRND